MRHTTTSVAIVIVAVSLLGAIDVFAQQKGPPPDFAQNAFQTLLSGADENGDGKISMEECYSIWKDKAVAEKNCKFWDVNSDGTITEEEYVSKAMKKVQ